jgi:hypothetical protein
VDKEFVTGILQTGFPSDVLEKLDSCAADFAFQGF